jgi:hypothetical protein
MASCPFLSVCPIQFHFCFRVSIVYVKMGVDEHNFVLNNNGK